MLYLIYLYIYVEFIPSKKNNINIYEQFLKNLKLMRILNLVLA